MEIMGNFGKNYRSLGVGGDMLILMPGCEVSSP